MAVAKTKAAVRQADKKNQKKKQKTSETERPEGESRHRLINSYILKAFIIFIENYILTKTKKMSYFNQLIKI